MYDSINMKDKNGQKHANRRSGSGYPWVGVGGCGWENEGTSGMQVMFCFLIWVLVVGIGSVFENSASYMLLIFDFLYF